MRVAFFVGLECMDAGGTLAVEVADASEFAEVDALLARAYPRLLKPDYPPSVFVTAVPVISRAQPELVTCGTYFVARDDSGRILGAGGWTRDRLNRRVGHVRHVVTDDRQVRRGVGRAILGRVLDETQAQGLNRLVCFSTRTAEPFYAAMGFSTIGPMEMELRPGIFFPAIRMERSLR